MLPPFPQTRQQKEASDLALQLVTSQGDRVEHVLESGLFERGLKKSGAVHIQVTP